MPATPTENLINTTLNSLKRAAELCQLIGANDKLPYTFASIGKYATLTHQILRAVLGQLKAGLLDADKPELFDILQLTKEAAVHLGTICKVVTGTDDAQDQKSDRYAGLVQNKDGGIEVVLYRLLQGLRRLIDGGMIAATANQINGLHDALDELSPMQPTTGGIVHRGTGDLFNNESGGRQSISKGNSMHNIASEVAADHERQRK